MEYILLISCGLSFGMGCFTLFNHQEHLNPIGLALVMVSIKLSLLSFVLQQSYLAFLPSLIIVLSNLACLVLILLLMGRSDHGY